MRRALSILLIAVCLFLLFWRLDGSAIWRDEGTTAVWARLMVDQGSLAPWVYDFDNEQLLVQAPDGHDVNSRLLPAMQGYLQFYVSALSFQLFGVNEWTARGPFAVLGLLTLFVFYRLGVALWGKSVWALTLPFLAATSLPFLHAARHCRYYVLVILGATLLLLELAHYLKDPDRAATRSFYAKLAAIGFLIYFSNYVSFVCTWTAVGLFAIVHRDWRFFRGFCLLCAGMAAVVLPEFFLLHSEFAGSFPPPRPEPLLDIYQRTFVLRGEEFWRMTPWSLVIGAAIWFAYRRNGLRGASAAVCALGLSSVVLPILIPQATLVELPRPLFALWTALCLTAPISMALLWRAVRHKSVELRLALPALLILIVSPLITIGAGRDKATTRHYYQILPPAILFSAMAATALGRRGHPAAGAAALAAIACWSPLNVEFGGTDEVIPRQFIADRSYNGPLIDFFEENIQPGDRVAFHRNVKGMALYFYFPEIRWVGLLDADAPHNQQFRSRIPADQFDDAADADWYVVWDPRGEPAPGLDPNLFDKVWEYSYPNFRWGWSRNEPPNVRTYEVYRRR